MSGIGGSRRGGSKNRAGNAIYEEIVPAFEWIEDSANHWLGLEVPGFRREEVKLEVNTYGLIKIAGERKISEIKYMWFEQIFQAPENSKPEDCRVGLEDGLFYVQIPKKATQKQQPAEKIHAPPIPTPTPAKTPRPEEDSDHEKGKKVNDTGEGAIKQIPASTPSKPPGDVEGTRLDPEKGKKVNDSDEGTIEKVPASTPIKPPGEEEGSDLEEDKKVNDSGDYNPTTEKIPASNPTEAPKDEEYSNQEKGKKVMNEGTSEEEQYDDDAKGEDKSNFWAKVARKVIQNKGIFLTAILILSAGFLVSQDKVKKVKSNEELLVKLDSQNHNNDDE